MALIKCPECGKEISDKSNACIHCGCPIMSTTQENSNEIENYIGIAKTALESQNGQEAYDYANKVLAIDSNNVEAWFIKMKSVEHIAKVGNPKAEEVVSCAKQVIKLTNSDSEFVFGTYKYLLTRAENMISLATQLVSDTVMVKNLTDSVKRVNPRNVTAQVIASDATTLTMVENLVNGALMIKKVVPDNEISNNADLTEGVLRVCRLYVFYHTMYVNRITIYSAYMQDAKLEEKKKMRVEFMSGLSDTSKQTVEEITDSGKEKAEANNQGCYIATCVYGSYDCPQVWMLRRFRDYSLSTNVFGRAFIKVYYAISPILVRVFGKSKVVKKIWKFFTDKLVNRLHKNGVEDTPYNDKY